VNLHRVDQTACAVLLAVAQCVPVNLVILVRHLHADPSALLAPNVLLTRRVCIRNVRTRALELADYTLVAKWSTTTPFAAVLRTTREIHSCNVLSWVS
jgi:hypothetical protein